MAKKKKTRYNWQFILYLKSYSTFSFFRQEKSEENTNVKWLPEAVD